MQLKNSERELWLSAESADSRVAWVKAVRDVQQVTASVGIVVSQSCIVRILRLDGCCVAFQHAPGPRVGLRLSAVAESWFPVPDRSCLRLAQAKQGPIQTFHRQWEIDYDQVGKIASSVCDLTVRAISAALSIAL